MQRRQMLGAILGLVALGVTAACDVEIGQTGGFSFDVAAGRAQDTWTRTYTLPPGGRLELINVSGSISAEPAPGTAVELAAERVAKAASDDAARAMLGKVDIREEKGTDAVRVEVRHPSTFGIGGVTVRWTVKVPAGTVVDLRNTNGKVRLDGLAGEIHARTVNGGVEAHGLSARVLEAATVNGGVDVEFAEPPSGEGRVRLESVNGGVRLALPDSSKVSVVARVTNGGIKTSDLEFHMSGEQTRRRFEGTLNGGGTPVEAETTNGGVRISKSGR